MDFERKLRLLVVQCCSCAVEYAIPEELNRRLLAEKEATTTYCPNGHRWNYVGKSDDQRVRDAEYRAREAERMLRAANQGKTPCPVCQQPFKRLATHRTRMKHWGNSRLRSVG